MTFLRRLWPWLVLIGQATCGTAFVVLLLVLVFAGGTDGRG